MEIRIREATINDAKILFDWANDRGTRQNSFNSDAIEWNDHILWFTKKLMDSTSSIFILLDNENPAGVVRFEVNENTIIGVTVAPGYRGRGLGAEIIKIACNSYWDNNSEDILAYIKKGNVASQRVFEKSGFTFQKEDIFSGVECLILKAEKYGN
jgi:spore coat polysaccharide biosynthesis protein SpsF